MIPILNIFKNLGCRINCNIYSWTSSYA